MNYTNTNTSLFRSTLSFLSNKQYDVQLSENVIHFYKRGRKNYFLLHCHMVEYKFQVLTQ